MEAQWREAAVMRELSIKQQERLGSAWAVVSTQLSKFGCLFLLSIDVPVWCFTRSQGH